MSGLGSAGATMMLVFGGLAAGGMLIMTVDRLSVWNRMPIVEYATDFRRFLKRVDPMMPIIVTLTGIGAVLFAIESAGSASLLAWIALALLVLIMVASVTLAEPVNSKFRKLAEGTPPEGADRYRIFWYRFHFVRSTVALIAFISLVAAVITAL
ncbi:DUF1772 domain-containing protein [Rhodococcus erythropolis]|nr:DUF1772 domain-containing protein [Rhodococcus erythropolis]